MPALSLAEIVLALPSDEAWGPATSTETTLDGVPYAPYSKGDKLGRMADWSSESKDGRERGGRLAYNRNYRGTNGNRASTRSDDTDLPSRSTGIWCRNVKSICGAAGRRRVVILGGEQRADIDQDPRFRPRRRYRLPWSRPTRRSKCPRRSRHLPARGPRTRRRARQRSLLRQPWWWPRRTRRSSFRMEGLR